MSSGKVNSEKKQGRKTKDSIKGTVVPEPQSASSDSGESTKKNTQNKTKKNIKGAGGKGAVSLLILVLVVLAFGGGGYAAYSYLNQQIREREAALAVMFDDLRQGINVLQQADQDFERQQDNLQQALTLSVSDMEAQMVALAERLSASESAGAADWTLAEVEYLLRIANQRLMTSRDTDTAVDMLIAADTILLQLAYPELAPVRRQISSDIAKLQLANRVDVEGIYFTLDALAAEVLSLKSFDLEYIQQPESQLIEQTSTWQRLWNRALEVLTRYIRIETEAEEPKYLLSQDQRVTRLLAVQLQIRQAQLALLSNRETLFKQSLQSAAAAITDFSANSDLGTAISDELNRLSSLSLDRADIDISASIRILSDIVDQFSRVGVKADGSR